MSRLCWQKGRGGSLQDDSVDDDGIRRANAMNHNSADPLTQTEFPDAVPGNTSPLLHKFNGVSYGNLGRLCYFRDLAFPHKLVIKFMQTTNRPVQYLAAEKLDAMIEEIKAMFLSGRTVGGQLFLDFKNGLRKSHAALSTEAKADVEALIERLETESKRVAAGFMRAYKRYVEPYVTCYIGLAQASPFALNKYVEHEDAGEGIRLVCNALGLDPDATELELQRVRQEVMEL